MGMNHRPAHRHRSATMRAITVNPIHAQAIMDGQQWIVTQASKPENLCVRQFELDDVTERIAIHRSGGPEAIVGLATAFACMEVVASIPTDDDPDNRGSVVVVLGEGVVVWQYHRGLGWLPETDRSFETALRFADFTVGRWAIFLTRPLRLPTPTPCQGGGDGLWELPPGVAGDLVGRRR